MGMEMDRPAAANSSSTPKLTLSKLPYSRDHIHLQMQSTPPLLPPVSIPFRWEEAPGKPRATGAATTKSKTARCLDLPPRLLHEEITAMNMMMPSPTTVLDGPYVGRSLSLACTFSFRKGTTVAPGGGKTTTHLGSGRWGSFREERIKYGGRDSMGFSQSLGDIFRSEDINNNHNNNVKKKKKKKNITRSVKRRRSFFTLSTINSSKYFLADIYASFKQAVPWRRS